MIDTDKMISPIYLLIDGQKSSKKQSEGVLFLVIRHLKYGAMLSKIQSYRLLFPASGQHWVYYYCYKKCMYLKSKFIQFPIFTQIE